MESREVVILCPAGEDHWEPVLIRGALWHHGIRSRISGCEGLGRVDEDALYLVLSAHSGKERAFPSSNHLPGPVVMVGHDITQEYVSKRFSVSEDEIVVYGEPYAIIPQLAMHQHLLSQFRGKAILGPLLDPKEYSTYPISGEDHDISIMTSLGCKKKCG